MNPEEIIHKLKLEPHPEGGFYQRTFLADDETFSSIYFLLVKDNFSAFHSIQSDEQWNWYLGDEIIIHEIDVDGNYTQTRLSDTLLNFQYIVKTGHWFASECKGEQGFALCGCTVIPAFKFENFELAERKKLIELYPEHRSIIEQLTR